MRIQQKQIKGVPMSHQLFEAWILSEDELDPQQRQALDKHLKECEQCRTLSSALNQVTAQFASSPTPLPTVGFTMRWKDRLSIYNQQREQQKMWFITLGLFALAGLIFSTVILLNINSINWIYEVGQFIANFSLLAARFQRFLKGINTLFAAFPFLIPIMVIFGVGMLSAITALIIAWLSSLINLYAPAHEGETAR
jgi:anti-sigma factor RsiW